MVFGLPGAWTLFAFYIIVGGFGSALGGVTSVAILSGKGPKMFDER